MKQVEKGQRLPLLDEDVANTFMVGVFWIRAQSLVMRSTPASCCFQSAESLKRKAISSFTTTFGAYVAA